MSKELMLAIGIFLTITVTAAVADRPVPAKKENWVLLSLVMCDDKICFKVLVSGLPDHASCVRAKTPFFPEPLVCADGLP